MKLDVLTGQASWNTLRSDDSIALKFSNIAFSNAHAAGMAYGNYWSTPDGPGVIDLTAHLTRADAGYVKEYIPDTATAYIPHWLADSMVEGQFSDIRLHLRGDLAEFPFVQNSGIFKLNARVAGLTLENISCMAANREYNRKFEVSW